MVKKAYSTTAMHYFLNNAYAIASKMRKLRFLEYKKI